MDAAVATSNCNADEDHVTSSVDGADRDQRHRARHGFGFKPPQAKYGRLPGPVAASRPPDAGVTAAGDAAAADNHDGQTAMNGQSDDHAPAQTLSLIHI